MEEKQQQEEEPNKPSKKELKRQLKRELILQERPAKRAAERARKKQRRRESSTPHEPKTTQNPVIFPAILALDCRFDDKMSDKEIVSLDRQIAHSYSINRKAPVQFEKLVCTSFNGRLSRRFQQNGNQYLKWKSVQFATESIEELTQQEVGSTDQEAAGPVSDEKGPDDPQATSIVASPSNSEGPERTGEESASEGPSGAEMPGGREKARDNGGGVRLRAGLRGAEKVVYLTADSPNVLGGLEADTVYVIGAIVDHNRYKNLCLDLALQHGFQHAQLPINQHFSALKSRKVLTVNQVVDILVSYLHHHDWEQSFQRVIPARKL